MIADKDELRKEAERVGLAHLTDEQLGQFAKAKASAEGLLAGLTQDLHMTDEPAHTFRAGEEV